MRKLRSWLGFVAALLVLVGVFLGLRWLIGMLPLSVLPEEEVVVEPTDAELRERFLFHRQDFDRFRDLLLAEPDVAHVQAEDPDGCVARDATWACLPIDDAKKGRYLNLLHGLGATSAVRDKAYVAVTVFAQGIVSSGIAKSISWMPDREPQGAEVVEDTQKDVPARYAVRYAPLDPPWYIERTSN